MSAFSLADKFLSLSRLAEILLEAETVCNLNNNGVLLDPIMDMFWWEGTKDRGGLTR